MNEHRMRSNSAPTCGCGAALYEDDHGRVFCEVGGRVAPYAMRHSAMCHKDDEGVWTCAPRCAVFQSQTVLPLG